jgi:hypothetical protein
MKNVFKHEPDKRILAFTTQKGHLSGDLMKNIDFRLPREIEDLKKWLEVERQIGDVFISRYVVLVVLRKHYNSKLTKESFNMTLQKALPILEQFKLKTTFESYAEFQNEILNNLPALEICETSAWGI